MDDDPSDKSDAIEKPTRFEIEQHRAKEIDGKIDQLLALSQKSERSSFSDEGGNTYDTVKLNILAPQEDSVLGRFGYSKVEITRTTAHMEYAMPLYPWNTTITTFDSDGNQIEQFYIHQPTKARYLLKPAEEAGFVVVGSDIDTGVVTVDPERIDMDAETDMIPAAYQVLEDQECLALQSIITACEVDDR